MSGMRPHSGRSFWDSKTPKADLHLVQETRANSKERDFSVLTDQKLAA
jgi:hypothetical protein